HCPWLSEQITLPQTVRISVTQAAVQAPFTGSQQAWSLAHTMEEHSEQAGTRGEPTAQGSWAQESPQAPVLFRMRGPGLPGPAGPSHYGPSAVTSHHNIWPPGWLAAAGIVNPGCATSTISQESGACDARPASVAPVPT